MQTTSFKIEKFRNGDIRFTETREIGEIRCTVEIDLWSHRSCEHYVYKKPKPDFPYELRFMKVAMTGVPGVSKIISRCKNLTISGSCLIGVDDDDEKLVFEDPDGKIIPKIKILLNPSPVFEKEWGIKLVDDGSNEDDEADEEDGCYY